VNAYKLLATMSYTPHLPISLVLSVGLTCSLGCTTELSHGREADIEGTAEPVVTSLRPSLSLEPCQDDPGIQCGTLEVPADYAARDADKLQLHVVRASATGKRIGSLFMNFGGPAGRQTDLLLQLVGGPLAPVREHFDLITFDPRGTPSSEPMLHCDFDAPAAPALEDSAARADYLDEYTRSFTAACAEQTGPIVTTFNTNNVARDVDMLRAALAERTLSLWTASYGTLIGAAYVSMFPRRVRALVLDGCMPDSLSDYTVELYSENAAAAELALQYLDTLCRADEHCALHDIGVVAGVRQVLTSLRAAPAASEDGSKHLDDAAAGRVINMMLGVERWFWPQLPGLIRDALDGNFSQWWDYVDSGDIGSSPDLQISSALTCNDLGSRERAAEFLPRVEAIETLYPLGRYVGAADLLRTCPGWPDADVPMIRNVADRVKTPALLIGNAFDPSTPISWTLRTAEALGMEASVLRYEGGGHLASFSGDPLPCVDTATLRYLTDLELPPSGSSCPAATIQF
jgi:pimeloyl-ACP methyl ester carboxylesterase